jgi:predicted MFS family arabinose efflux permease
VEGYEQLRQCALCGDAAGWRLGLAVLQHRGVAAWLGVWRDVATPAPTRPGLQRLSTRPEVVRVGDELVGVLASMALHAVARR